GPRNAEEDSCAVDGWSCARCPPCRTWLPLRSLRRPRTRRYGAASGSASAADSAPRTPRATPVLRVSARTVSSGTSISAAQSTIACCSEPKSTCGRRTTKASRSTCTTSWPRRRSIRSPRRITSSRSGPGGPSSTPTSIRPRGRSPSISATGRGCSWEPATTSGCGQKPPSRPGPTSGTAENSQATSPPAPGSRTSSMSFWGSPSIEPQRPGRLVSVTGAPWPRARRPAVMKQRDCGRPLYTSTRAAGRSTRARAARAARAELVPGRVRQPPPGGSDRPGSNGVGRGKGIHTFLQITANAATVGSETVLSMQAHMVLSSDEDRFSIAPFRRRPGGPGEIPRPLRAGGHRLSHRSPGRAPDRRLYLGAGFSSLFTYCCSVLHLSEPAAYNRIEAARAARRFPVILGMLGEGSLSLATVRLLASHLTAANHQELLAAAAGKSKRDVEELLVQYFPGPDVPSSVRKLPAAKAVPTPSGATLPATSGATLPATSDILAVVPVAIVPSAGA